MEYNGCMFNIRTFSFLTFNFFSLFFILFITPYAYAQFDPTIQIKISPQQVEPGSTIHLTVTTSSFIDVRGSTITWVINDSQISKGVGNTTLDVTAGPLGQKMNILVEVQTPDKLSYSSLKTIISTHIDLLVDSDSYTPPFY